MFRLNNSMNKIMVKDFLKRNSINGMIGLFGNNNRTHSRLIIRNFSSVDASNSSQNYSSRYIPLEIDLKTKKFEELYESISKRYEKLLHKKTDLNLVSYMKDLQEIGNEESSNLSLNLKDLYNNYLNENFKSQMYLENLTNETILPKLKEFREKFDDSLRKGNMKSLREETHSIFKLIQENLNSFENKMSLFEDTLKIFDLLRHIYIHNKSLGKKFLKESLATVLKILTSSESLTLSIEVYKTSENLLFYAIENHLNVEEISDADLNLSTTLSTNILKSLEKFGDTILKYSGEKSSEMFNLYFLLTYYHLNTHNQDYSKAEEYIQRAAAILKQKEDSDNSATNKEHRHILVSYITGEIQLKYHKNLKVSYSIFTDVLNLLSAIKKEDIAINREIFEIVKIKSAENLSNILLASREKIEQIVEISDKLIWKKESIDDVFDVIKHHPNAMELYSNYLLKVSDLLFSEGYKRKGYEYLKYSYNLKRKVDTNRGVEIDLFASSFEDSGDYFFFSQFFGNPNKWPSQDKISVEALQSYSQFLSDVLRDSVYSGDNLESITTRIKFANQVKNILDTLQKFKTENGIKFENYEEKFNFNNLISTIRLNFISADFEKAAENLTKAIELLANSEIEALVNLNFNLFYALSLIDRNDRTIKSLENLKSSLKNYFKLKQDMNSVALLIESNLDLFQIYFEQSKVNEGIDCLIEASDLNKQLEKVNPIRFEHYLTKLKKIRDEIKNLKDKVEADSQVSEEKQILQEIEKEEQKKNQNKKALYGIFSQK